MQAYVTNYGTLTYAESRYTYLKEIADAERKAEEEAEAKRKAEEWEKNKCPNCNGTGYAKFYYGDSDLEAILSGHDPYWFDTCPLCHGTGR